MKHGAGRSAYQADGHEAELERLGVEHLYMSGSTVRDEAHAALHDHLPTLPAVCRLELAQRQTAENLD